MAKLLSQQAHNVYLKFPAT